MGKKMKSSEFLQKEMTDLQELVKEIEEKVVDFKEMKAEATKKLKEAFSGASEAGATAEKPVSSIMVKRKSEAGDALSRRVTPPLLPCNLSIVVNSSYLCN